MRFLLSRRWLYFAIVVVLMAWGATLLGQWQFHRLHEKRASNHLIVSNLDSAPVPLSTLLRVGKPATTKDEWRPVTVTGTWDDQHTIVVKYQTSASGAPGVHLATPLVTPDGTAVIVDRGWMATANTGGVRPKLPPLADSKVTVTGWVRVDATGGATVVSDLSTRAISSSTIAKVVPYKLYGGFLDLDRQAPETAHPLGAIEMPDDTGDGPHFFYGLQWWFFGFLAVTGFFYLMYDEWKRLQEQKARSRRSVPRTSQRA